jgi:periplasmic protein CpxP/Spy
MTRTIRLTTLGLALCVVPALGQAVRGGNAQVNRPALEQQFRERVARLAQTRIGLNDGQMAQLQQSNARFGPQLNQVAAQERETRRQLRFEMTSPTPNQQRVSDLLDRALQLQKQRIAIVEAEQKDLARFMTPVQRARYIALQQQFRKRAQELAGQNAGRRGGGLQRGEPGIRKRP